MRKKQTFRILSSNTIPPKSHPLPPKKFYPPLLTEILSSQISNTTRTYNQSVYYVYFQRYQLSFLRIENSKSGVYKHQCNDCLTIYIRQTGRDLRTIVVEHENPNNRSSFAAHLLESSLIPIRLARTLLLRARIPQF